jgi:hypothetical protein
MPSLTPSLRKVGRLVACQLERLHATLERLAGEVRSAIARAVGQVTGETVREALCVILDGPIDRPRYQDRLDDRNDGWGQSRRPSWPSTRSYDQYGRDPYERDADDDFEADRRRRYDRDEEEDPPADESAAAQRQGNWSRAVATGCQAAAWWLRRHQGPFSLIAAAGIGIAAGVATLVHSPLVAGATAVAASALGLLALADAARSATGLADQVLK